MSTPQLENGYLKIANEYWDVLCLIRIRGEARQMLDVIIRKTWGFNKKEDKISTSQFMQLTGLSRPVIQKVRKRLLDMNLITVSKKGYSQILTYRIQKDYKKWKVYTKKDTVSKNGYRCIQKRIQNCIQFVVPQKTIKDNIQNTPRVSELSTLTNQILTTYQAAKHLDSQVGLEAQSHIAVKLYHLTNKSLEDCKAAITWLAERYEAKHLDWTLWTVVNKLAEFYKAKKTLEATPKIARGYLKEE